MIVINQSKISKIETHLPNSYHNKKLIVGVMENQATASKIVASGLAYPLRLGDSVLPAMVGKVTKDNAVGKFRVRKDLPKEKLYREMEFTRTEWRGRGQSETVTSCVWIPYERNQRELVSLYAIEVSVNKTLDGRTIISSDSVIYDQANYDLLKHTINLYLELYGFCIAYEEGTNPIQAGVVKKLNWTLLPKGQQPWSSIKSQIVQMLGQQKPKALAAALDRFEKISTLKPDFHAYGSGGYRGYVVFGFEQKNIYVLESQNPNNAIYIFEKDWQGLSMLSKAEILNNSLHKARVIHGPNWFSELKTKLS